MQVKLVDNIERWPIERLKKYERNARTHSSEQIDKIAASILRFGFNVPILVDSKTEEIIAGHGRLEAAKELGLAEVPVVVLTHLTEAERRAYILADNRTAEEGRWNYQLLEEELNALDKLEFDLKATAFSERELDALLVDFLPEVPPEELNAAPLETPTAGQPPVRPNLEGAPSYSPPGPGSSEPPPAPAEHWGGMPEFKQEDQTPYRTIYVHFANEADVREFERLVHQTITEKTKSIWFPKAAIGRIADKRYSTEEVGAAE